MRHFAVVEQRTRLTEGGDLQLDLAARRLKVGDEGVGDAPELGLVQARRGGHIVVFEAAQHEVAVGDQPTQAGADDEQRQQQHKGEADEAANPVQQVGGGRHPRGGGGDSGSHTALGA